MARSRSIPTRLFFSPDFMSLSSDTIRLLMLGIILNADDYGRGEAHAEMLGRKLAHSAAEVDQALQEMEQLGIVQTYEVEGRRYFWLCHWKKYQTLSRPTPSHLPPAPGDETTPQNPQGNSGHAGKTLLEGEEEGEGEGEVELKRRESGEGEEGKRGASAATAAATGTEGKNDVITQTPDQGLTPLT